MLAAPVFGASLVVADFNDLETGDMRASNPYQPANSGVGFGDAHWATNTAVPKIVFGDLVAPATTGYAVSQGGRPRSFQALNYTIPDDTDRRMGRALLPGGLKGSVWFSFLLRNPDASSAAGIDFNVPVEHTGTRQPSRIVIEGGTLRVFNASLVESGKREAIVPTGETVLVLGRIDIGGSGERAGRDRLLVWINPVLTDRPAGLGPAALGFGNSDFLGGAAAITHIGLQSYDLGRGGGQNGGVLDSIRLADGPDAYWKVTGVAR